MRTGAPINRLTIQIFFLVVRNWKRFWEIDTCLNSWLLTSERYLKMACKSKLIRTEGEYCSWGAAISIHALKHGDRRWEEQSKQSKQARLALAALLPVGVAGVDGAGAMDEVQKHGALAPGAPGLLLLLLRLRIDHHVHQAPRAPDHHHRRLRRRRTNSALLLRIRRHARARRRLHPARHGGYIQLPPGPGYTTVQCCVVGEWCSGPANIYSWSAVPWGGMKGCHLNATTAKRTSISLLFRWTWFQYLAIPSQLFSATRHVWNTVMLK